MHLSTLYCSQVIESFSWKVAKFNLPYLCLAPLYDLIPLELTEINDAVNNRPMFLAPWTVDASAAIH